jgi:hypothetical protein
MPATSLRRRLCLAVPLRSFPGVSSRYFAALRGNETQNDYPAPDTTVSFAAAHRRAKTFDCQIRFCVTRTKEKKRQAGNAGLPRYIADQ